MKVKVVENQAHSVLLSHQIEQNFENISYIILNNC